MSALRHRLDLQLFAGEKTERATPKKRQDARKKGQVAKSQEIPGSLILLGSLCIFMVMGPFFRERILLLFGDIFLHRINMAVTDQNVLQLFYHYAFQIMILLSPIWITVIVIAFAANIAQVGWLMTLNSLKPNLGMLNPISGAKNLFNMRSVIELCKSAIKLTVIGLIVYWALWSKKNQFLELAHVPIESIFAFVARLILQTGMLVAACLFVLSIGDFLYNKFEYEKKLKMSKQDIKDEHKNAEGDPLIKSKIKEKQRRMALMRMMQEVPKADVVITNPTHFAVALRYDGTRMDAPVVVAKGQDYLALRIREIARKHDVAIMENKPLARALYDRSEVGDMIPADLFQAVAEVLAYVYRLKGRHSRRA
ncbi:flagellar biosynthesis protein FlhB [Cohnella caldifontis]|uniref:flagellar biosynthesis protein FlhB n=1 Tax=Cohnella caldifontis TaxID=3027471 RepID=UPI0023EA8B56|nr:flagellar biosynthesis protein FlhB [Cohnella sp. YIM B05605]